MKCTHVRRVAIATTVAAIAITPGLGRPAHAQPSRPAASSARSARTARAGDFDGDGKVDLAIGAPGSNRVRVSYTHARPAGSAVQFLTPSKASYHYSMMFGSAIAVGDFNGDGFSDLAVGAPDYTTEPPTPDDILETRGAVFIFHGSAHGLVADPLTLVGPYDDDDPFELGDALAAADVNGDGRADLAVHVGGDDYEEIRLYHGSTHGLRSSGYQTFDDYDADALAFGDVDGDGHVDLVAGSTTDLSNPHDYDYGDVEVFHGTRHGISASHPQRIRGDQVGIGQNLGSAVAVGDLNRDGYNDVVVGAADDTADSAAGTIVVLFGSRHGLSAHHRQLIHERDIYPNARSGNEFGSTLRLAKISGRRYPELVVGAAGEQVSGHTQAGAVYLLRGTSKGLSTHHIQRITAATHGVPGSPTTQARFGEAIYTDRLLGSDKHADLVIGAPGASAGATRGGQAVILRGRSTGISTAHAQSVGDNVRDDTLGTAIG